MHPLAQNAAWSPALRRILPHPLRPHLLRLRALLDRRSRGHLPGQRRPAGVLSLGAARLCRVRVALCGRRMRAAVPGVLHARVRTLRVAAHAAPHPLRDARRSAARSRKRRIDDLSRLRVGKDTPDEAATMSGLKGSALFAECTNAKPLLLAAGYPRTLPAQRRQPSRRRTPPPQLHPGSLAPRLVRHPRPQRQRRSRHARRPIIDGDRTPGNAPLDQAAESTAVSTSPAAPPPAQPANSKITFLPEPDSLTFLLPRTPDSAVPRASSCSSPSSGMRSRGPCSSRSS